MEEIRVRFAPSPTGSLHIGGARTALFNWLFARKYNGVFVLRLEDTDLLRSTAESSQGIIDGLQWLGLDWDEGPDKGGVYGPYRQSERLPIYRKYLDELLANGQAYYCFCSSEELQQEKEAARNQKRDYKYSRRCRQLSPEEVEKCLKQGLHPVIRIKAPDSGTTVVHDLIRGDVEFNNALLDDFIIAKSDGWPTYNFAVVVDDASMKITHVIRAEEHLSNTPKQLLVYEALGLEPPKFAHASMILAPDRSKLSKRHGATSVQEFRDEGYLPEALLNYLALLGWSSGEDRDLWTLNELIPEFSLDGVSRSPAIYDIEKLTWMNGHYISNSNAERLLSLSDNQKQMQKYLSEYPREYLLCVLDLVGNRVKTLNEIPAAMQYFCEDVDSYDAKGVARHFKKANAVDILNTVIDIVEKSPQFEASAIEALLRQQAEIMQLKAAELIHPTRLALSGRTNTPGLFEVMEVLGREKCLQRLKKAVAYIESRSQE
ncbi:MAG: glutamate--tRNA ligase [Syntrophomonadaceae bacterium]|nr:glutamate--tRNA ligase [Syntrophomonadaceae bacterium]